MKQSPISEVRPPLARAALSLTLFFSLVALLLRAPLTTVASGGCLAFVIGLLWTTNEPPILLLPAIFQWSEVAAWPLSAMWKGVPLNQLSENNADLESSAMFGLVAVAVLAVGLRVGSGKSRREAFAARIRAEAVTWQYRDVARVSFGILAIGYLAAVISAFAGPSRELLNQISNVKYVGLFAFTYWCLLRRSHLAVLACVISFEVVSGMTGFFAEFKNLILTLLVAALAARPRLRCSDVAAVSTAGIVLLGAAIFWTAIKPSYRNFVNKGTGAQVALEPLDRRLGFLVSAADAMDRSQLSDAFDRLVSRHGYIEYLALTMQTVPTVTPHENGRLTLAVLKHIAVPRFLYPDKAPLPNDTEITARYTGLPFILNDNVSISIGYLGELYVDFGLLGALVAVGGMGGLAGLAYRTLRDQRGGPVLMVGGLCLMAILPLAYFGQAYSKTVGSSLFSIAIAFLAKHICLPLIFRSRPLRPGPYPMPVNLKSGYEGVNN